MQEVALMEVLLPVKHATFSIENDLMEMTGSDPFTFATCYSDKVGSLMQPVILTTTIVSSNHVHKTVVNTKSGTCNFIKGKDELPNWLIASASQHYNPDEGASQAMIRDCKDGLNCMFLFEPGSPQETKFKNPKCGTCLKNIPKFSNAPVSDLSTRMSFSPLVLTPMSLALQMMLNYVLAGVIKYIGNDLKFIVHHKEK